MPRRMSCSMTIDAVRTRTKTVTRRHVDTWTRLAVPADRGHAPTSDHPTLFDEETA